MSNRLPVTVEDTGSGINYLPSAGGLATGLSSLEKGDETIWIGWPGKVQRTNQDSVAQYLRHTYRCEPVFLSERLVEKYYDGYSNRTLWPLFHSFQSYAKYSAAEWDAYKEANLLFMQALDQVIQPGDTVWIHDYQLLLLPELIRARHPNVSIGFFLHIPFPAFEVLRLLPQHKELLKSLLCCDLVGFHTHEYLRAFLNGVHRALGVEDRFGEIVFDNHIVHTMVHPMGIDFDKFSTAATQLNNEAGEVDLKQALNGSELIFSVSRLDYTKGILESIEAYELLLERKAELRGKVTYVMVVVPSREKVEKYARLKRDIDEAVGRINSKFGQVDWTPVKYIYRSLSFNELVLLYKNAEVGLVTPLRDGLNLVAKEYVAARNDESGVLILSEMAGAAKELLEAVIVNPHSREEMAGALYSALTMPAGERKSRMSALRERLLENPVQNWSNEFLARLRLCSLERQKLELNGWGSQRLDSALSRSLNSEKRLFIFDYDGTLMPLMNDRTKVRPDARLLELLEKLASKPKDEVLIISGRSRKELGDWFKSKNLKLVAEHGAWMRTEGSTVWQHVVGEPSTTWKPVVRKVLDTFVDNIPGSSIEEKEFSLVWHYRRAEGESADIAAKDLVFHLLSEIGEHPVRIVPGNRSIEIRCIGVGKGVYATKEVDYSKYDFILAAGDDLTDEDLFSALPKSAATIKIGAGYSRARIRLRDHLELRRVIEEMINEDVDFSSTNFEHLVGKA